MRTLGGGGPVMGKEPAATVSIDVDPLDAHLAGYGVADAPCDPTVYQRALPRLRELLAELGLRATFFVVGRDAAAQAGTLRQLALDGHELASHSWSHPVAFAAFPRDRIDEELRCSRDALAQASGTPVVGFRAPGWDEPASLATALTEAGYRYDASSFPSPLLGAARLLLYARSRGAGAGLHLQARSWWARRRPHRLGGAPVAEFPVAVTRALRLPVYHTLRYGMSEARFARALDRFAREGLPLSYPLHAVDALGLAEDGVDARLAGHPGMRLSLDAKLALLRRSLAAIAERFSVRPFAERLQETGAA